MLWLYWSAYHSMKYSTDHERVTSTINKYDFMWPSEECCVSRGLLTRTNSTQLSKWRLNIFWTSSKSAYWSPLCLCLFVCIRTLLKECDQSEYSIWRSSTTLDVVKKIVNFKSKPLSRSMSNKSFTLFVIRLWMWISLWLMANCLNGTSDHIEMKPDRIKSETPTAVFPEFF